MCVCGGAHPFLRLLLAYGGAHSISDAHSSIVKKTTAVMKPTGSTYTSSSCATATQHAHRHARRLQPRFTARKISARRAESADERG
eukprot:444310-Prymnesium_polylepis.1